MSDAIVTPRLICKPLKEEHASLMFPLLQDQRIYEHIPDQKPESVERLRERYQALVRGNTRNPSELWLNWILFIKNGKVPIGYFQATIQDNYCSIGYVIGSPYWRQHYGSEACLHLITELFATYPFTFIQAEIDTRNHASLEFVKKMGFIHKYFDEANNDEVFETTRSAWQKIVCARAK